MIDIYEVTRKCVRIEAYGLKKYCLYIYIYGHGYSQSGSAYKQCCNAYSQSGSAYKQCCNAYSQSGSAHKQCCNAYSQSGSAHKQCENGLFAEHSDIKIYKSHRIIGGGAGPPIKLLGGQCPPAPPLPQPM